MPARSGGDHREPWPPEALEFLREFLPLLDPPNYQLVADELERLVGFKRTRSSVEAYIKKNFQGLVPEAPRKQRQHRRFRRAQQVFRAERTSPQ